LNPHAHIPPEVDAAWDARRRELALHIPPRSSVLDLGCGLGSLENVLPPNCRYLPVDIVHRHRAVLCDLDRSLPYLPEKPSIAVAIGLLEWLSDLRGFFRRLSVLRIPILMTYNDRRREHSVAQVHGWKNHLTLPELRQLLRECGYRVEMERRYRVETILRVEPV
jgi:hypothetical protein